MKNIICLFIIIICSSSVSVNCSPRDDIVSPVSQSAKAAKAVARSLGSIVVPYGLNEAGRVAKVLMLDSLDAVTDVAKNRMRNYNSRQPRNQQRNFISKQL
jgi:hypothetical protein